MEDVVICPNCGETNPADMAFCHNCQWRLRALDDDWAADHRMDGSPDSQAPAAENTADGSVPDWLRLAPTQPRPELAADEAAAEQLRQRLSSLDQAAAPEENKQGVESQDLLAGLSQAEQPDDEPIPEWVARIMGITDVDESEQSSAAETDRRPEVDKDWHSGATPWSGEGGAPPVEDGRFDTISPTAGSGTGPEGNERVGDATTGPRGRDEIYEWLRQLDADKAAPPVRTPRKDVPATTDVPTWVGRMMGVQGEAAKEQSGSDSALPNWLQGASEPQESSEPSPPRGVEQPAAPLESAALLPATEPVEARIEPPEIPAPPPVPVPHVVENTRALDVDAVLASMQMPQWASNSESGEPPGTTPRPPAPHDEASIQPADLPSWVQSMRPVESAVVAPGVDQHESPGETGGPLRGLGAVLPAVPGAGAPSSRPMPQSMKLDVSDRHRAHARLLEEMLEAETRPHPLRGAEHIGSPRALRWLIGGILISLLMLGLVSGSTSFLLPAGVPRESDAAIQVVQGLAPESPVLAVFDYEPATAGEMEVAAASLLDHLLLMNHPRLALISTSPTGSALAERFVSTSLRERAYVRGQQYVDLGYLPGGLSGVQLFARDPVAATPYGAATDRVWDTGVLLGAKRLTDFSAILVLTDSLESGSVWIEQTTGQRGATPMVIVASAQAGPMLLPYFDSGQIQGLVVGINGAAGTEIVNDGRPGLVRRYWDAYNLGLYAAALLITVGAFWQLASGWRRRRAEAA